MRQIKFRAWDGTEMLKHDAIHFGFAIDYHNEDHSDFILMQFTGLADKNGKEIYEGDIVSFGNRMYEVCINFNGYYLQRYKLWRGGFKPAFQYNMSLITLPNKKNRFEGIVDDAEVIGNIYENPDLLKGNGVAEDNKAM